jgi:ferredoxin
VNAIYAEEDVPVDMRRFVDLNARLAKNWPSIEKKEQPLPDAERWSKAADKLASVSVPL